MQPGFKGGLLLTDPSTGKAIGLTMLETEADLNASENSDAFRGAMAAFAQALAGPPTRDHYEVSVKV